MNIENPNVIPIVHNEASGNNIINLNPSILNQTSITYCLRRFHNLIKPFL